MQSSESESESDSASASTSSVAVSSLLFAGASAAALLRCLAVSRSKSSSKSTSKRRKERGDGGDDVDALGIVVAGTWKFSKLGIEASVKELGRGGSLLDAIEKGIYAVEMDTSDQYFVGYRGLPNSNGTMQLDGALWDGKTDRLGCVMALENSKSAIRVARGVLEKSIHNIFVGDGASEFRRSVLQIPDENALHPQSADDFHQWKQTREKKTGAHDTRQHDTVGLVGVDEQGNVVAGTSTSGWAYKPSGRVGDSPLVGSGLYVDNDVGAAVATGDGEEIMKSCLCKSVIDYMKRGCDVRAACRKAVHDIEKRSTSKQLTVGVVAVCAKTKTTAAATTISSQNPHVHECANDRSSCFQWTRWHSSSSSSVDSMYCSADDNE